MSYSEDWGMEEMENDTTVHYLMIVPIVRRHDFVFQLAVFKGVSHYFGRQIVIPEQGPSGHIPGPRRVRSQSFGHFWGPEGTPTLGTDKRASEACKFAIVIP